MAYTYKRILKGLGIVPKVTSENAVLGDLEVLSSDNRLYFYGASNDKITTDAVLATLSSKSLNSFSIVPTLDSSSTGSNVQLTLTKSLISLSNASLSSIGSIVAGSNGQYIIIKNTLTTPITLVNEYLSATAADRIITGTGSNLNISPNETVQLYYNTTSSRWIVLGLTVTSPGISSIGTIDSVPPSANGSVISGNALIEQSASATVPGLVNNTSQTFTGVKTFTNGVVSNVTGNVTGNLTGNVTGNITGNVTGNLTGGSISVTQVELSGSISGKITQKAASTTTDYTIKWPSAQSTVSVSSVPINDGAGNLSWALASSLTVDGSNDWELNGAYPSLTYPLLNIDAIFFAPINITITSVWIYNGDAGSGGTTEYDLKVASPGGGFTTILSTTGKITSAAAANIWTDSGSVVTSQTGVTKPVLSTTAITAGQAIKFDLITSMTGTATDARIRLFYRAT